MMEHRPKVLLYNLHVAIVSIVSMWPHVVWMFPKDPPKRRGANDTQWAHHMKHFLSAQGCSWCSATLTAKPSAAQWDRQHQSAAKKSWVIECSSVLLCASVPPLMYCWRPKMETGKWWQWNTQVYTACMYRTDYPATKTGMRIAYDAVLQFH